MRKSLNTIGPVKKVRKRPTSNELVSNMHIQSSPRNFHAFVTENTQHVKRHLQIKTAELCKLPQSL